MPCPVEVKVRRGRVVYRAGDEGGGGSSERAQAGATAGLGWGWYNGGDRWGEGGWVVQRVGLVRGQRGPGFGPTPPLP